MWGESDEDVDGRKRKGICGERVMRMYVDERRRKGICWERVMRMWTGGEGKEYVGKE